MLARPALLGNTPRVKCRLLAGSGAALTLALLLSACGSRTQLLPEICRSEGAERACSTGCGDGVQLCSAGLWQACETPIVTRACSDACGPGEQACVDGAWQSCEVQQVLRDCSSVCGSGHETCRAGVWSSCDAPRPRPPELKATIRDFSPLTQPDFEAHYPSGVDHGIVMATLGVDDTPVYAAAVRTQSTSGAANFDEWFHDYPINRTEPLELQLTASKEEPGTFEYSNDAFFPIDGELLGNEGRLHNYHFTLQASTSFQYRGGEVFSFEGDDDMWVFVNRRLAIDLGGTHQRAAAEIALDSIAESHGLTRGSKYPLHFFFAERQTFASTFTLRTTIADPGSCD
jgi:fibro-slime domain-containing protein